MRAHVRVHQGVIGLFKHIEPVVLEGDKKIDTAIDQPAVAFNETATQMCCTFSVHCAVLLCTWVCTKYLYPSLCLRACACAACFAGPGRRTMFNFAMSSQRAVFKHLNVEPPAIVFKGRSGKLRTQQATIHS